LLMMCMSYSMPPCINIVPESLHVEVGVNHLFTTKSKCLEVICIF
jgi:hypothetical protein